MTITVEAISIDQKSVLAQMLELYSYDFTEFSNDDLDEDGHYGYSYIDAYWSEEGRYPYFIRVDGKLAGFILVRSCCEYSNLSDAHNIAEFFIMRKYRHAGVGKTAAKYIFDCFPGAWEVSQWENNLPAQKFWDNTIKEYTHGQYVKFISDQANVVVLTFDSRSL